MVNEGKSLVPPFHLVPGAKQLGPLFIYLFIYFYFFLGGGHTRKNFVSCFALSMILCVWGGGAPGLCGGTCPHPSPWLRP